METLVKSGNLNQTLKFQHNLGIGCNRVGNRLGKQGEIRKFGHSEKKKKRKKKKKGILI